jgi:dynein heavy chain
MRLLELGHKEGHWVMLQNIHLMPKWLPELEKKLDAFAAEGSNLNFRLYLTAEPSVQFPIPIGILERCIKLTNEPPSGLRANMMRAFGFFPPEEINEKDNKVKSILFGLCFFHSVVVERKKFGSKGWNRVYPFAMGDLRDSVYVLNNQLESN